MTIRKAENGDIKQIIDLLSQVLEIHAEIRPDIFVSGTTKYSEKELENIINNQNTPIFVASEEEKILGYAFCAVKHQPQSDNMVPFKSIYIDDLCVSENARGKGIGKKLFHYVSDFAREIGCYEVNLNVWSGNDSAQKFYENLGFKPMKTTMEYIL